jgi:hypothetical protein
MNTFCKAFAEATKDFFSPLVDFFQLTHKLSGKISRTFQIPLTIIFICVELYAFIELCKYLDSISLFERLTGLK